MGKESDYQEDFVNRNKHLPVPYDDDAQMAEYLMVSTIIQSITVMKRRLRLPSMKKYQMMCYQGWSKFFRIEK